MANSGDCNDGNVSINPAGVETCNGIDDNCSGQTDEDFDADGDGYATCGGDCNDDDAALNPGVLEDCGDGIDNNCDDLIDCTDNGCSPDPVCLSDIDNDGIRDFEEKGPDGVDTSYDGNQDGIADYLQNEAVSLHSYDRTHYVTLACPNGLSGVLSLGPLSDAPEEVAFPYGFFRMTIDGVTPGGEERVTLYFDGEAPNTYYLFGSTIGEPTPHWYEFLYDGKTGAEIRAFDVTLHFVDGDGGDDNPTPDGTITSEGGPGIISRQAPLASGGGGGCSIIGRKINASDAFGTYGVILLAALCTRIWRRVRKKM